MEFHPLPPPSAALTAAISARLRDIRQDYFGEEGIPAFALRLGVPPQTWRNYENGVTIPGPVLLRFLAFTGVEPSWLLSGTGPTFRPRPELIAPVAS